MFASIEISLLLGETLLFVCLAVCGNTLLYFPLYLGVARRFGLWPLTRNEEASRCSNGDEGEFFHRELDLCVRSLFESKHRRGRMALPDGLPAKDYSPVLS
ncbi:MAG: hypothetical protein H0X73_05270 [Chthoniobacterales bacterium]|nr:hypothetical protein [Chthoniobacterales bacterium]